MITLEKQKKENSIDRLQEDIARILQFSRDMVITERLIEEDYSGAAKEIAHLYNSTLERHQKTVLTILDSKKSVSHPANPGVEHPHIENVTAESRPVVNVANHQPGLHEDIEILYQSMVFGDLKKRIDPGSYQGDLVCTVSRINNIVDTLVRHLDTMPTPIFIIDSERTIRYINALGTFMVGKSLEEIIGTKCSDLFQTSHCQTIQCAGNQCMHKKEMVSEETQATPLGVRYDITCTANPLFDENGIVIGAMEIILDQTEIKQAGRIAKKQADFQATEVKRVVHNLENLTEGVFDLDLSITQTDSDTRRLAENFVLIHKALQKTVDSIKLLVSEVNLLSNKAINGYLLERIDNSQAKGSYQQVLAEVNNILNILVSYLDHVPTPVIIIDHEFRIRYINKSGAMMVGKPVHDLINAKCSDHFKTSHCRSQNCVGSQCMKRGEMHSAETKARPLEICYDLSCTAIPVKGKDNTIIGAMEIIQDQTEIRQANRIAQKQSDFQAEEVNRLVRNLEKIALGDLDINVSVGETDTDTRIIGENFVKINRSLDQTVNAIRNLISDSHTLSTSAVEGDLSLRVDTTRHNGDFRKIVEGFNKTLGSVVEPVNETLRVSKSYADYNFTDRFSPALIVQGDWIQFKDALNNIGVRISEAISLINQSVSSLSADVEEANASIEEITSGSEEITSIISLISRNSELGDKGTSRILSAMNDMIGVVGAVSTKAESVAALSHKANTFAKQGMELAKTSDQAMKEITKSSEQVGSIISDINEQMNEIGKIVKLISDIASQTNLLALNAAIEAARAGDAGRGFAVVAAEVKTLAQDSRKSAENIADLITALKNKAQSATGAMSQSNIVVQGGSKSLVQTLQAFTQIAETIETINSHIMEVASASEEQAASVQEVTASMQEISSLTHTISKETISVSAASEETSGALGQINQVVANIVMIVDGVSDKVSHFKV